MQVRIFKTAEDYAEFVNYADYGFEIISVVVFDGKIVVTFKVKAAY